MQPDAVLPRNPFGMALFSPSLPFFQAGATDAFATQGHPLFPLTFNQSHHLSVNTFNHPEASGIDQQEVQIRRHEQLKELEAKFENQSPAPVSRQRSRTSDRKIKQQQQQQQQQQERLGISNASPHFDQQFDLRNKSNTLVQGPIAILPDNNTPVVPLYSFPVLQNGTLIQIPVSHLYIFRYKVFSFYQTDFLNPGQGIYHKRNKFKQLDMYTMYIYMDTYIQKKSPILF